MKFVNFFIMATLVALQKEVLSYTYHLDEYHPQFRGSINVRTRNLIFIIQMKFAIIATLVEFRCPLEDETKDPPYLEVQRAPNEPPTIWKCNNSRSNFIFTAPDSVVSAAGVINISRPIESNWSLNWAAQIVGTVYQIADGTRSEGSTNFEVIRVIIAALTLGIITIGACIACCYVQGCCVNSTLSAWRKKDSTTSDTNLHANDKF